MARVSGVLETQQFSSTLSKPCSYDQILAAPASLWIRPSRDVAVETYTFSVSGIGHADLFDCAKLPPGTIEPLGHDKRVSRAIDFGGSPNGSDFYLAL